MIKIRLRSVGDRADEKLSEKLVAIHKQGNTAFIAPIVVANTSIIIALSYDWSVNYLVAVLITLLAFIVNVSFVKLNPTLSTKRNDHTDAFRWCINFFAFDAPLSILMTPSIEGMCFFWVTLILGAFIEIYALKLRVLITGLGITAALTSLYISFPDLGFPTYLTFISTTSAILIFVRAIEMNWIQESTLKLTSIRRESELENQAASLFKLSLTGENARLIAHEVDNMITAINFATDNPNEIELDKINLSLGYVKHACDLIMKETTAKTHSITVKKLLDDVNLLLRKQVESKGIEWNISCQEALYEQIIHERVGSCYFILQNFVRNAINAVKNNAGRSNILLQVEKTSDHLLFTILDNGKGIKEEDREKLLSGKGSEIAAHQHGIGMRFVLVECSRNGYEVFIEPGTGIYKTAVGFKIPLNLEA